MSLKGEERDGSGQRNWRLPQGNTGEMIQNWKLQLHSANASSRRNRSHSKSGGLMLSAVSDALRRDACGLHVHVPYPTHSMTETSALLTSRYNTLWELYEGHATQCQVMEKERVLEQRQAQLHQTLVEVEKHTSELEAGYTASKAKQKQLQLLECQCLALERKLAELENFKVERQMRLESALARLEEQECYWRDLWKHTRQDSPVTCVLAEQLEKLWQSNSRAPLRGSFTSEGGSAPPPQCLSTSPLAKLAHCIAEGQTENALKCLRSLPQEVLEEENNILHWACAVPSPNFEVVQAILHRRPQLCRGVDATTGNSPLNFACAALYPDLRVVQALLDAGTSTSIRNNVGLTAFHLAVLNLGDNASHSIKTALLQSGGAVVDERTSEGLTALHLVCGDDSYLRTSEYLVRCGASLWALASHQLNYPPYSISKITPIEKSRVCYAVETLHLLREAMKSAQRQAIL